MSPLIKSKSKQAFKQNMEAEINSGKPQAQSLAIAYATKRSASKKKKMAYGGMAEQDGNPGTPKAKVDNKRLPEDEYMADHFAYGGMAEEDGNPGTPKRKPDDRRLPEDEYMADHFAKGGEVEPSDLMSDDERATSIADAIMRKRHKKKMAEGGMVDLEANSEESPNMEDQYSFEANGKEQYDDSQISKQPMDSNETGDSIESDAHDMVSKIRAKIKAKRGM